MGELGLEFTPGYPLAFTNMITQDYGISKETQGWYMAPHNFRIL